MPKSNTRKLNDTQLVILSSAVAARGRLCGPA